MSIFSAYFGCFLIILAIVYFLLPKKIQWIVLLAGNLIFYAFSGSHYLIYLFGCAFISWYSAVKIENNSNELAAKLSSCTDKEEKKDLRLAYSRKSQKIITVSVAFILGVWIVLKYGRFLFDSISPLFCRRDLSEISNLLAFVVPLGMSFYIFDAIGYLVDVSKRKYPAERNFLRYLTFLSFFPHIIQGPFSRFDKLGKILFAEHRFSFDRLCQGTSRILWGYFKKLIIADKLAVCVNEIFTNYENYYGIHILFVMILYGFQIYADFSGYMDIVSGVSHIFGIELEQNFRQPYFSTSIEEFWRRWHMTLGHWFRDYMFFPISRSERVRKIRNKFRPEIARHIVSFIAMFWVWSASGLWHGANWTFLIWGWMNMAIILTSQILDPWYEKFRRFFNVALEDKKWHLFRVIRTFFIACFLFFFTRVDSLKNAVRMIRWISHGFNYKLLLNPTGLFPAMRKQDIVIVLLSTFAMMIVDYFCETEKWEYLKEKTPFIIRCLIYSVMIFMIILFAGTDGNIASNFIYANF